MRRLPLGPDTRYLKKVKRYLEYKLKPFMGMRTYWNGGVDYILLSKSELPIKVSIYYGNFYKTPMLEIEAMADDLKIVDKFRKRFPYAKVKEVDNGYVMRYQSNVYSAIYSNEESYNTDKEIIKKLFDLLSSI